MCGKVSSLRVIAKSPGEASAMCCRDDLLSGALRSGVHQVAASVLRVNLLVVANGFRFLRSEAHRFNLAGGHAEQCQRALHRISAPLPQRQIVLPAAALVAVAFDPNLQFSVRQ
jgi:hypothetical protein